MERKRPSLWQSIKAGHCRAVIAGSGSRLPSGAVEVTRDDSRVGRVPDAIDPRPAGRGSMGGAIADGYLPANSFFIAMPRRWMPSLIVSSLEYEKFKRIECSPPFPPG